MKRLLLLLAVVGLLVSNVNSVYAQLDDEEYNYVTMDLQGILNLTMTTDPQVDFTFNDITDYEMGITRFNATQLEVDATLAWDLFVYANTDEWVQVEAYSANGNNGLPAEILELQSSVDNSAAPFDFYGSFESLAGLANSTVAAGVPTVATQYLAGEFGTGVGESFDPGTAANNPATHKFRIDMRLVPDIPATFPNSTEVLTGTGNGEAYAMAGYYYLEVVYALIEDL